MCTASLLGLQILDGGAGIAHPLQRPSESSGLESPLRSGARRCSGELVQADSQRPAFEV
jgi:hypothetical protein